MSGAKVPAYGNTRRAVLIKDVNATYGATVGVNLYQQDGTVISLDDILNSKVAQQGGSLPRSTDSVPEGQYNLYFTTARAQTAAGAMATNSANVTLTYNAGAQTLTPDLTASGVSAGTYGDATHVSQVTIDVNGRVTSAASVSMSAPLPAFLAGILTTEAGNPIVTETGDIITVST